MRISDWSSDVCSSDLVPNAMIPPPTQSHRAIGWMMTRRVTSPPGSSGSRVIVRYTSSRKPVLTDGVGMSEPQPDRKSVVSGKSVSVGVDLGGRRFIQNKRHKEKQRETIQTK